jgi:hypothetical protein
MVDRFIQGYSVPEPATLALLGLGLADLDSHVDAQPRSQHTTPNGLAVCFETFVSAVDPTRLRARCDARRKDPALAHDDVALALG